LDSLNCNTCAAVPSSQNDKCLFTLESGATNYVKNDSQTTNHES
jgi:hypothetical protein